MPAAFDPLQDPAASGPGFEQLEGHFRSLRCPVLFCPLDCGQGKSNSIPNRPPASLSHALASSSSADRNCCTATKTPQPPNQNKKKRRLGEKERERGKLASPSPIRNDEGSYTVYGAKCRVFGERHLGLLVRVSTFFGVPFSHVFLFLVHSFRVGARQECGFPCIERGFNWQTDSVAVWVRGVRERDKEKKEGGKRLELSFLGNGQLFVIRRLFFWDRLQISTLSRDTWKYVCQSHHVPRVRGEDVAGYIQLTTYLPR